MGRNLEDIRRLRARMTASQLTPEEIEEERLDVKQRILGTLLEDARLSAGRTSADTAAALGVTEDDYRAFESGEASPTLPQLEVLAYYFNVPISHFWRGDTLAVERREETIRQRVPEVTMLRQRIIGVRLQQLREQAGLSVEEVAERTGFDAGLIEQVEYGQVGLPFNQLEKLAYAVGGSPDALMDGHGPIGGWLRAQDDFEQFASLPAELRAFVLKPINRSYLELALRLSDMEADRLRTIAESILEITL
jgi:transcriptional regulator with XRE-family HTH domain